MKTEFEQAWIIDDLVVCRDWLSHALQLAFPGITLRTAGSPDAMPDGGVYPLEQGATLLTPPPAT